MAACFMVERCSQGNAGSRLLDSIVMDDGQARLVRALKIVAGSDSSYKFV